MSDGDEVEAVLVDLSTVSNQADLHEALAAALGFPPGVGRSWDGFRACITGDRPLPEGLLLKGLDHLESVLPDEAKQLIDVIGEYNDVPDGARCLIALPDDYRCSMYYLVFEAVPTAEADLGEDAKGAMICCWVKTASAREAHRLATKHIAESGWMIVAQEEIKPLTRDDYGSDDDEDHDASGLLYYYQACVDGMTFVFHTWSSDAEDDDAGTDVMH